MTIGKCLKKMGLSKHESAIMRALTREQKTGKRTEIEAAKLAVQNRLRDLRAEKAAIESQVQAGVQPTEQPVVPAKPGKIFDKRADQYSTKDLQKLVKAGKPKVSDAAQDELNRREDLKAKPKTERQIANVERLKKLAKARKKIDIDTDTIIPAIAKLRGLSLKERPDILGDRGNRMVPFVGALFTTNGMGIDDMATRLADDGYLTPVEMESVDGGVQALRDKIEAEFNGDPQWSTHSDAHLEREAEAYRELAQDADAHAKEIGATEALPEPVATPDDLEGAGVAVTPEHALDADLVAQAAALDEAGFEALSVKMQDATDIEFAAAVVEFIRGHQRDHAQDHQAREAAGEAAPARPELALTAESPEDLKRKAAEQEAAAKAETAATKKAEVDAQAFNLTGSDRPADVGAAAGQQDLLSQPASALSAPDLLRAAAAKMDEAVKRPYAQTPPKELQRLARETDDEKVLAQVEDELNTRVEEKAKEREERLAKGREAKAAEKPKAVEVARAPLRQAETAALTKLLDDIQSADIAAAESGVPAIRAAVNSVLTDEDKAAAAVELGDASWNADNFIARYAEWVQQGAKDLGTKLSELFQKVLHAARNGALSIAIAVNFNVAQHEKPLPMTITQTTVKVAVERPKADFKGVTASTEAKTVADWMVRSGKNESAPFIIADKQGGLLYAFDGNGALLAKSPALFGKARGDIETNPNASIEETKDADKITPAGVFQAKPRQRDSYGRTLDFKQGEKAVLALHRVYLGTPSEKRMERLQSESPDDKRISYGCINALPEFIDGVVVPHFTGNSQIVILPETVAASDFFDIHDSLTTESTITTQQGGAEAVAASWGSDKYAVPEKRGAAQGRGRRATPKRAPWNAEIAELGKLLDEIALGESNGTLPIGPAASAAARGDDAGASPTNNGELGAEQPARRYVASQTDTESFKRWSNSAPLVTSQQADSHDFKTGERVVVEAFHGTKRPDRVGTKFQKKRATSGPMAFHTSDPALASSYATGKSDTSLNYEDTNYDSWFRVKVPGSRNPVNLDRYWYHMSGEEKSRVLALAPRVTTDENGEEIILGSEENKTGNGGYHLDDQDVRGNPLKGLIEAWLNSGSLFGQEDQFPKVLRLAGMNTAKVEMHDPGAEYPFVYKNYISMQNPLVTTDIPQSVKDALAVAAKRDRSRSQQGGDIWDKNSRTIRDWMSSFTEPAHGDNAYVWTSIPDKVTEVLKSLGYDGIIDKSGKGGGPVHPVYIPFHENQVKSAIGNKGTFSLQKKNILEQPKQAYNEAQLELIYDHTETRPGTTPEQKSAGIAALRALFGGDRRAGATLLGSALWKDFQSRAGSELIGATAGSPDELALAAQILRDPRFETLRVFYVKAGKIVGHTGWTSRLPGSVAFAMEGPASTPRTMEQAINTVRQREGAMTARLAQLREQMKGLSADGYYLMHNHPSGRAEPSFADNTLTRNVAYEMKGFLGHIVIDHNEYAVIDKDGNPVVKEITKAHFQPDATPELAHDALGQNIASPAGLVSVARMLQINPGYATLVTTNGAGQVQALAEVPENLLLGGSEIKNLRAVTRLKRFMTMSGSHAGAFLVADRPERFDWLLRRGALTDVVHLFGGPTRSQAGIASPLSLRTDAKMVTAVAQQGPAYVPAWVQSQPAETQEALRKAGIWHQPATLKDRVSTWTADWQQRVRQGLVDQFDPIKKYDYKAYMHARMTKGADAALEGVLMNGTIFLDKDGAVDVNYERGGFLGILSKLQNEHDRFFAWVIGNRAERLLAEGKEHNFTPEDIARLKVLNQGKMKDGASRFAAYELALTAMNRYNKSLLDMAEKSGLIDPDSRSVWEKDFYIPFYRMMEEEKTTGPARSKGLVRQYAFKTLKGGAEVIGDPLENVLKNWAHLIDASLKNQAAKESVTAAEAVGAATEAPEETAREMAKAMGKRNTVIHFMDNGMPRYYVIDDPFLLDAIQSLGFSGFQGAGMQAMQKVKHWLTFGVTISPTFRIRNIIRDSLTMIGTNPASYNVLDNIVTGWKMTKEGDASYASLIAGGGVMRYGTHLEGDRAAHVKKLIEAGIKDDTILDTPEKVKAMLTQAWDWWMSVGDRSENVNRAALYNTLRQQGKSHLEASYAARDTMDFSMQGTWAAIRFLAQTVPFFNARLQGLYKLGRGAMEDPQRFSYVVGAASLASIALLLAYKDDEDWKQREDFDRESYWWFKIGDKAFRLPKPFEIGAIGTLAERAAELMITDELTGKQFAERLGSVISQQLSMNPIPQLLKPLIETWANKSFFTDRPIESMGMDKLSRSERIGPNTSATAQFAGKAGLLSPVQIDHLINGYFGWLGTHIVATADLALNPIMGMPGKPAARIDELLVAGDFVKDLPAYQSKYVTHLYDQAKKVQESMADYRHALQLGNAEKAAGILQDQRENIGLARLYTATEAQLSKVNTQIKIVIAAPEDAETKRRKLDALYAIRNSVAKFTENRARDLRQ